MDFNGYFSDCKEVGGQTYALLLYTLAESVEARRILEIGAGWGHSAVAFTRSLSNRANSVLVSIDPAPERVRKDCADMIVDSGVVWDFVPERSADANVNGPFDLIYIDGDPTQAKNDLSRFVQMLREGGLLILDGYGGQPGPTSTADTFSFPFTPLRYNSIFSFAVFHKPTKLNSAGKFAATCEDCAESAIMPSWVSIDAWADRHIVKTTHNVTVYAGPRNIKYKKGARN